MVSSNNIFELTRFECTYNVLTNIVFVKWPDRNYVSMHIGSSVMLFACKMGITFLFDSSGTELTPTWCYSNFKFEK